MTKKKSLYRDVYVFSCGMTQQTVLSNHYDDDIERMMEVRDYIEESPDDLHLFEDNPLESDSFLYEIDTGESKWPHDHSHPAVLCKLLYTEVFSFIDDMDSNSGEVKYVTPNAGN